MFIRFRDPLADLPAPLLADILAKANDYALDQPTDAQLYAMNRAWSAVYSGFEVQIDDTARGDRRRAFHGMPEPDGLNKNRTGAIYKIPAGDSFAGASDPADQQYTAPPALVLGRWYRYEITARGSNFRVVLVDTESGTSVTTTTFTNTLVGRGLGNEKGAPIGHVGLQSYPNSEVAFRRIEMGAALLE